MKEVEVSAMNISPFAKTQEELLSRFTSEYHAHAKLNRIDWNDAWNVLVRSGLNGQGPDVSEIGTTWLGGLHSMDALRPFTTKEANIMGGPQAFQPAVWEACHFGRENQLFGIPFVLDVRIVLYRRDWLQKAGVEEATAFSDAEHFAETLRRIQAVGHPSPIAMSTSHALTRLIHDLACWVWSAGGEIRSNDGRRMLLMEDNARAGMRAYFAMHEFLSPEMQGIAEGDVFEAFSQGKAAVALLSERGYLGILSESVTTNPEVRENTGMAMLMRAPFVGGSVLGIWRYSHNYEDSLKLIEYLTSVEAWKILNQDPVSFTSARIDILQHSKMATTPFFGAFQQSLQHGRSFQTGYRWSGVESRLVAVIENLWSDLRANPELNLSHEIDERFASVCTRLEQTILAS